MSVECGFTTEELARFEQEADERDQTATFEPFNNMVVVNDGRKTLAEVPVVALDELRSQEASELPAGRMGKKGAEDESLPSARAYAVILHNTELDEHLSAA